MQDFLASVKTLFDSAGYGPLSIALSFLLGLLSAVASACCTLPLIGVLAGYSVARREDRASVLRNGLLFMAGMIVTVLVIGGVVVFAGQTIQKVSGDYWKIAAGCTAIAFGIGALELFPFKLPKLKLFSARHNPAAVGSWISGIVFGGAIAVSSLPCNPGIFIILGAAVLQKHVFWAFLNLSVYAIGFSAPLTMLVLGLSLGKSLVRLQKAEKIIRISAGLLLIAAGIYLFYSF
jgi:cytochrome c biogenesis protein CcdA